MKARYLNMGEKEILTILQEAQDFDYENLVKTWNDYCVERGYFKDVVFKILWRTL